MADPITLGIAGAFIGKAIGATAAFGALGTAVGGAAGIGLGFAAKAFLGGKGNSAGRTLQDSNIPQVANEAAAKKTRRIGRAALIFTDQEDILGETPSISRNELIAF